MVRITPKSTQHTGMSTSPEGSIAALGKRFRRLARAGKHRNHRGHRPDPYAPLLPAVIMCGPRNMSRPPFPAPFVTRQDEAPGRAPLVSRRAEKVPLCPPTHRLTSGHRRGDNE